MKNFELLSEQELITIKGGCEEDELIREVEAEFDDFSVDKVKYEDFLVLNR